MLINQPTITIETYANDFRVGISGTFDLDGLQRLRECIVPLQIVLAHLAAEPATDRRREPPPVPPLQNPA